MPDIPIVTLEEISHPNYLRNLLIKYPEHKGAIFEQLLNPPIFNQLLSIVSFEEFISDFAEYNDELAKKKLLNPDMLTLFAEDKAGISLITALANTLPDKKDHIAVLLLHLDRFKALVETPESVQKLINEFQEHKNGIANLVSNKEVFQALATTPAAVGELIRLFPELPEYRNLIAHHVFEPNMITTLIDNKIQNAFDLARLFPEKKNDLSAILSTPGHMQDVLQTAVKEGTPRVAELCRVFADSPKLIRLIAELVLKQEALNAIIHSAVDVKELSTRTDLEKSMPGFKEQLAKQLSNPKILPGLINKAVDIEFLSETMPKWFKQDVREIALTDEVFEKLLYPSQSSLNPIKRIEAILTAMPGNKTEVAEKIVNLKQMTRLLVTPNDVELLIKALPEHEKAITQFGKQILTEKPTSIQGRNTFFKAGSTTQTGEQFKASKEESSETESELNKPGA